MTWEMLTAALAAIVFTTIAMTIDLKKRKIPNWLTVPVFFAGLVFHGFTPGGLGWGYALGGFAVGFGLLLVLWLIGGGGGGDVKLMGALGTWIGPFPTFIVFIISAFLAVFISAAIRVQQTMARESFSVAGSGNTGEATSQKNNGQLLIPFAVPVAFATWLVTGAQLLDWWSG